MTVSKVKPGTDRLCDEDRGEEFKAGWWHHRDTEELLFLVKACTSSEAGVLI